MNTIAIVVIGIGGIGAIVSGLGFFFAIRGLKQARDDTDELAKELIAARDAASALKTNVERLAAEREALQISLKRETVAKQIAEKQRDELLDEVVRSGDPHAVAATIRRRLQSLTGMSEVSDTPNVPGMPKRSDNR